MSDTNGSLFDDLMSIEEAKKLRDAATFREWNEKNKEKRKLYKKEYNERTKAERSASYKIWYEKNKEAKLEKAREWKRNNPDKVKAYFDEWVANNPERRKEHDKRKYEKNKDAINARTKIFYQENRERILERTRELNNRPESKEKRRKYAVENKERRCLIENRRRARKLNASGEHTLEDINNLFELQKKKCAGVDCHKSIKKEYHVDHIVPLSRGGSNDKYNIQLLCPTCNMRKSARDPILHNQSLGSLL